jgi:2-(1,2-epoxy-1,2-dihydrophenyl)acetyl-CoA isomerase
MGMAMLGDRVQAEQAEAWGMIYKAVEDDDLDTEIERVTSILKVTSPEAMRRIRTSIESASQRSFSEQLDVERDHQEMLIPMNMVEGAAAFLEKRDPRFR